MVVFNLKVIYYLLVAFVNPILWNNVVEPLIINQNFQNFLGYKERQKLNVFKLDAVHSVRCFRYHSCVPTC
jgi:hypothetical protein